MKKIAMIALLGLLVLNASAQKGYGGRYYHYPRTYIVSGWSPYYGYGYYPPYWSYPPSYYNRPSRLDMKLEDIRADYQDKIRSARQDKSLSRTQRKEIIRNLKSERNKDLRDTKANYYKR